jgi:hypothetical protein
MHALLPKILLPTPGTYNTLDFENMVQAKIIMSADF